MPTKNKTINPKQKKFCDIYLSTNNIKKAIDEAGYKVSSPSRVFETVEVGKYLVGKGISKQKINKLIFEGKRPTNNLTMKELKFCNFYLASGDINQSAIEAGYAISKHGHADIVRRKHIVNYLKERRRQMEEITDMDVAFKLKKLAILINSVIGKDESEVDKKYASLALTAIEIANEMQGHNAPRSTIIQAATEDVDFIKLRTLTFELLEKKRNKEIEHARTIEHQQEPK